MYFVPEGQHDSSQARSAWTDEENRLVPAGRLNGSRLRLDANIRFNREYLAFLKRHEHSTHSTRCRLLRAGALSLAHAGAPFRRQISLGLTMTSTVPPGRIRLASCLRPQLS